MLVTACTLSIDPLLAVIVCYCVLWYESMSFYYYCSIFRATEESCCLVK